MMPRRTKQTAMSTPLSDAELDKLVATYLRTCGRPVDMDKLVRDLSKKGRTPFEIKESVWRLLDQHAAELTPSRSIFAVAGQ
jgi:hypothetical protein